MKTVLAASSCVLVLNAATAEKVSMPRDGARRLRDVILAVFEHNPGNHICVVPPFAEPIRVERSNALTTWSFNQWRDRGSVSQPAMGHRTR